MSGFEENEISKNANGGTELIKRRLAGRISNELLDNFQIICSRVRELDESKTTTYGLRLGIDYDATNYPFNGYLSNFRVVKDTAVYTANFTPPTTALTAITNTVLLTCQDNRFKDNSTNNFALTTAGNVSVEPESPFSGGSLYFDAYPGGLVTTAANSNLVIGTGDFTLELWIKPAGNGQIGSNGPWSGIIRADADIKIWGAHNSNDYYQLYINVGNTDVIFITPSVCNLAYNVWHHIALVRSNNVCYGFVNGTLFNSIANTTNITQNYFALGSWNPWSSYNYQFYGYISNVRLVKGTALYTSNFTVPKQELTAVSGTQLLTAQSSRRLIDASDNNLSLSTSGAASVSTAGPGLIPSLDNYNSVYFDGANDWLSVASNSAFSLTGDFTIECWMYARQQAYGTMGFQVGSYTDGVFFRLYSNDDYYVNSSGGAFNLTPYFPIDQWNHVAIVRSGTSVKLYANGVEVTSAAKTISGTINATPTGVMIGGGTGISARGYISNFRVVKGTAVYTSNFTPSTQPLKAITNTSLLACQYETFDDASSNNFTLTASGTPVTSKFNPYETTTVTYKSAYFSSSALRVPYDSSLVFGTNNFTVEFFLNLSERVNAPQVFLINDSLRLDVATTNALNLLCKFTGATAWDINVQSSQNLIKLNNWHHIAVVRNGTTFTVYLDGTAVITQTGYSQELANYNTYSDIGAVSSNLSVPVTGSISNFRVVNGVAKYTSTFTPPAANLTVDGQTTALIAGTSDVSPRNKIFTDESKNNVAVTGYGDATQTSKTPYPATNGLDYSSVTNIGSAYFDGNGDYLTLPYSSAFNLSSGEFTVELWIYINSNKTQRIIGNDPNYAWSIYTYISTSTTAGVAWSIAGVDRLGGVMNIGKWNHLAISKVGSTTTMYINGIASSTTTFSPGNYTGNSVYIGRDTQTANGSVYDFNGYLSDIRIVKGAGVYKTNFPVPTKPVGLYSLAGSSTSLYLPFNSGSIIDQTGKNAIQVVGGFVTSGSVKNYSTNSLYFKGSNTYISPVMSDSLTLGSSDFTIEFWINFTTDATDYKAIASQYDLYSDLNYKTLSQLGWILYMNSGNLQFAYSTDGTTRNRLGWTINPIRNRWYHIAIVRSGGNITPFIDGVSQGAGGISGSIYASTRPFTIGTDSTGSYPASAYIDDFRVTKGVARYTANFTVPATNLPTAPIYTQPVVTGYQDQGTDLGSKYVTKSYLTDWYQDLIPALQNGVTYNSGYNMYGTLMDGTVVNKSSLTVGIKSNWKDVKSVGGNQSYQWTFAIDSEGYMWSCGENSMSKGLGDGTSTNKSSITKNLVAGTGWKTLATASNGGGTQYLRMAGIKTDGTLWVWGYNNYSDGTVSARSSPVTVAGGGTNWKQVSVTSSSSGQVGFVAVKTDGTLWTWGVNTSGQLGTGNSSNYSSPVTIAGGGTNWKQASITTSGGFSSAGIKTDGTLWVWGLNAQGQLGTGNTSTYSSPVTIAGGGNDWKQVALGNYLMMAIKTDGTLWTCGYNTSGQLGTGNSSNYSSPVTIAGGGTNWKQVSCGYRSTAAIKTDGTLWTWGWNGSGQLGDRSTTNRSSPVAVGYPGVSFVSASIGGVHMNTIGLPSE